MQKGQYPINDELLDTVGRECVFSPPEGMALAVSSKQMKCLQRFGSLCLAKWQGWTLHVQPVDEMEQYFLRHQNKSVGLVVRGTD